MKNVIVFAVGQDRYAVELRWVREVFTLGSVTPVAHAPDAVAGVVNYRGAIVPVLDLTILLGGSAGATRAVAHGGEGAILIEVEEVRAALRVTTVVEVSTLRAPRRSAGGGLTDSSGRSVLLIDPPALLARAQAAAQLAGDSGRSGEPGRD
jgi:chemotaxis signal transduction protein